MLYYDKCRKAYWKQINRNRPPYTGIKEIDIKIMFYLSNHRLHIFSRVNRYIRSLYNDDQLWIDKIYHKHPTFPIRSVLQNKKFTKLFDLNFNTYLKTIPNIKGLYYLLYVGSIGGLSYLSIILRYTEIAKWLLSEYDLKPNDQYGLFNAITANELDYVKFLHEDCGQEIDFFCWSEAVFRGNLDMVQWIIPKYKYNDTMISSICKCNKIKDEIVILLESYL